MGCGQRWKVWVVFLRGGPPLGRMRLRRLRHATGRRQLDVHLELGETSNSAPCLLRRRQKTVTKRISAWQQRDGDSNLLSCARALSDLGPVSQATIGTRHTVASFSSFFLPTPHPPPSPITCSYYPGLGAFWFP